MTDFLDMRCPNCGDNRFIDITATVRVRVTDANASSDRTYTIEPDSLAFCWCCGFRATVRRFERPAADAKEGAA